MKIKEIYLQDIKPGDKIASSFLVAEKSMAFSQKGSAYLNVRLKDKTGETDGKVWDNAAEWDRVFKKGDIIYIEGRAQSYRNTLQISIITVKPCAPEDTDPSDYLPVSKMDT
ncbi:MAG: OB-fold nucleic acid binding domain-containing protein, partial [Smithella sp.]